MALVECRACGFEEPAEARAASGLPGRCDACDAHARLLDWVASGCEGRFALGDGLAVVRVPEATQEFLSVASRAWASLLAMTDADDRGDALRRCLGGAGAISAVLGSRDVTRAVLATTWANKAGLEAVARDLRVVASRPSRGGARAWAGAGTLEGLTPANIESTGGYRG